VKNSIKKWYSVVVEPFYRDTKESVQSYRYSRHVSIVLLFAAIAVSAFWGYRWWHRQREEGAQKALSEGIYAYQEALQGKDDFAWGNVAMLFNVGHEQHSSSSLAPFFIMFNADALLRQGNRAEAIVKFEEAIKTLPKDSAFLNLYKTKLALVRLDDETSDISEQGLKELNELANNAENSNRDMALYYVGLYYWSQNNIDDAKVVWQKLVDTFKDEKIGASPWVGHAREKLDQIV